jgi:hypothetical protein
MWNIHTIERYSMIDSAIYKAMGSGNMTQSKILRKTFDWVFMAIATGSPLIIQDEDSEATHEDFDLSKYETLHEFFNSEVNGISPDQYSECEQELRGTSLMDNLAYEVSVIVDNWIKLEPEFEELRKFTQILVSGVLFEVFKTEIHTGSFEKQLIASCANPQHQSLYRALYRVDNAVKQFPDSCHKKQWLKSDLGM